MRTMLKLTACAAALTLSASCGEEKGPGGLTAEEARKLEEHANRLDGDDVVDASPDSLVADDEWMQAETANGAGANAGVDAPAANGQ